MKNLGSALTIFCLFLGCKTMQPEANTTSKPVVSTFENTTGKVFTDGIEVLFVGNSQTYINDVPRLIQEIGEMDKTYINYVNISKPDYSLGDHWNEGEAQSALSNGKYQFMIGQQGSSALPESQVLLKEYAKRYADLCKNRNVQLNLYMVWPMTSRMFDLDNVIYSYTQAAAFVGASLSPVGLAWKKVWEKNPKLALHDADGLHANKKGSVLAAMTIYASLFKKKDLGFIDFTKISWKNDLTADEFQIFRRVVEEIIKSNP